MVHELLINTHNCRGCRMNDERHKGAVATHGECLLEKLFQRLVDKPEDRTLKVGQLEAPQWCKARIGVLVIDEDCMR